MSRPITRAESIERDLAVRILRGEWSAQTILPPVRELAKQFEVAPPTIQRVIDRLQSSGLVTARRGSGVRVNDRERLSDLSLLPLWFEALVGNPTRACEILADFLELRRVLLVELVRTRRTRLLEASPAIAAELAAIGKASDPQALSEIDLAVSTAIVVAAGQFAVTAVFRATERIISEVPAIKEAFYGNRENYVALISGVAAIIADQTGAFEAAQRCEVLLREFDEAVTARFHAIVAEAG